MRHEYSCTRRHGRTHSASAAYFGIPSCLPMVLIYRHLLATSWTSGPGARLMLRRRVVLRRLQPARIRSIPIDSFIMYSISCMYTIAYFLYMYDVSHLRRIPSSVKPQTPCAVPTRSSHFGFRATCVADLTCQERVTRHDGSQTAS